MKERLMMNHRSFDIFVVAAIAIVATALALTPDNVPGRFLAVPLVLVLPGYALTSALFAKRALGVPERLVFSLALSLVIVILGGLLLNWTPFGLHTISWSVLLGGVTLSASALALVRRQGQSVSSILPHEPGKQWQFAFVRRRGQSVSASGQFESVDVGLTFRQVLLFGLALVVVCGAVFVSIIGAERQPFPGFTQLWILPESGAIRLGVNNMELAGKEYRLDVSVDGHYVKEWHSIDLMPNEKWEASLVLPQIRHAGTTQVEAQLYTKDAPTRIYRHVILWLRT
jgi:uncharacterized membrane protein